MANDSAPSIVLKSDHLYRVSAMYKKQGFEYAQGVRFFHKSIFVSVLLLIIPSQSALASESWSIDFLTDLTKIEQFENRELGFQVSIRDKEIIQTLTSSGAELTGNVLLVPTSELTNKASAASDRRLLYTCYNPKPSAIAGNTGGSALRPAKTGDESLLEFNFRCWFPIGMRLDTYSLHIILLASNTGNGKFQTFLFGNYPDSKPPAWMYQQFEGVRFTIFSDTVIQNISSFPIVEVVRSEPKTSPDALTFNSKNLVELTQKLNENAAAATSLYAKNNSDLRRLESEINASISQAKTLLSKARKKENANAIRRVLAKINLELMQVKAISTSFSELKSGSPDSDVKRKYLFGLDFDAVSKPEILVTQYPDIKTLKSIPTPYFRFVIKSKTAITSTDISLYAPSISGPVFAGNVSLPGNFARNNQYGGGLSLVENQQWDGSMFITSLLVGPRYTPVSASDLAWMHRASCLTARFEDAAGNISDLWLGNGKLAQTVIPNQGCLPEPTQAISAAADFDNLVVVYNNLAEANEKFQETILIPETMLGNFETLPKISQNVKAHKLTLAKLKKSL
jgi:hypothetical protein